METFDLWLASNKDVTPAERERFASLMSLYSAGREHQKIELPFSQSDLEDLMNGDTHNWAFETDRGEIIDLELYNEDSENDTEEEE